MRMAHPRQVFLSVLGSLGALLSFAPGCSGGKPPSAEVAIHFTVSPGDNSAATCQVGGGVDWSIGDPDSVTTVSDGSAHVAVQCAVSGNNSSGFTVTAQTTYGTIGSFLISGHFPGPAAGSGAIPTATGIHAEFNSNQGLIADMSANDCTVTFTGNQGIAPSRIWGVIDCPDANDPKRSTTCDGNAEFLFENCSE
jgi:hypothetical protein